MFSSFTSSWNRFSIQNEIQIHSPREVEQDDANLAKQEAKQIFITQAAEFHNAAEKLAIERQRRAAMRDAQVRDQINKEAILNRLRRQESNWRQFHGAKPF